MKSIIEKRFNEFCKAEYYHHIYNHKKYANFNTLALYRSLIETEKLSIKDKIEIRDVAHQFFLKSFEFLQVKAPLTYFKIKTLGQEITQAEEHTFWKNLKANQDKILSKKKIKHRNFGVASKNYCHWRCPIECDPDCIQNPKPGVGMMMKGNKPWHCHGTDSISPAVKERKNLHTIIKEELDNS